VLPVGRVVLNADDAVIVAASVRLKKPIFWIALDQANPVLQEHQGKGGDVAWLENGRLVAWFKGERLDIAGVADIPITLNGVARHNVYNALGVTALALVAGIEPEAIARGLRAFQGTADENPGRLNIFDLGGARVIADFAHNPHGMDALVDMARAMPAIRRLIVIGQAGDRDDQAIRDFAKSAWRARPNRIVLKEMEKYLRGRVTGEASGILRDEFLRLGAAPESMDHADSEFEAVRAALAWAQTGDMLLLPLHSERDKVLGFLDRLRNLGWKPGEDVPTE
jgi:UDP-N-acetylmuramyl tripeptide synthase